MTICELSWRVRVPLEYYTFRRKRKTEGYCGVYRHTMRINRKHMMSPSKKIFITRPISNRTCRENRTILTWTQSITLVPTIMKQRTTPLCHSPLHVGQYTNRFTQRHPHPCQLYTPCVVTRQNYSFIFIFLREHFSRFPKYWLKRTSNNEFVIMIH